MDLPVMLLGGKIHEINEDRSQLLYLLHNMGLNATRIEAETTKIKEGDPKFGQIKALAFTYASHHLLYKAAFLRIDERASRGALSESAFLIDPNIWPRNLADAGRVRKCNTRYKNESFQLSLEVEVPIIDQATSIYGAISFQFWNQSISDERQICLMQCFGPTYIMFCFRELDEPFVTKEELVHEQRCLKPNRKLSPPLKY